MVGNSVSYSCSKFSLTVFKMNFIFYIEVEKKLLVKKEVGFFSHHVQRYVL